MVERVLRLYWIQTRDDRRSSGDRSRVFRRMLDADYVCDLNPCLNVCVCERDRSVGQSGHGPVCCGSVLLNDDEMNPRPRFRWCSRGGTSRWG